ncbi:MAG: dTMP kinase [bacterium]|nr:dTMP kinase [bacterium]
MVFSPGEPATGNRTEMCRYIALEGIDGAGKTSIQAALRERLESVGIEVVAVREPGGTLLGESLRRVLLDGPPVSPWAEALMFAADRAQLMADVVRPALERGACVVSDRSVYSSLAYQGAGRALGIDRVRRINEPGLAGRWPDLVILLAVSTRTGLARQRQADRIGSSGHALLSTVAEAFDTLARQNPDRFVVVDAERPRSLVVEDVWEAVGL